MKRFSSVKKIFAGMFALTTLVSCSNQPQMPFLQQQMYAPVQYGALAKTATTNLPVHVSFNNAYKITTEENEAIGRKSPNTPDKYFLGLIKNARKSIDGAFYDIDDLDAARAFVDAHKRGVKVRLITDTDNLVDKGNLALPRQAVVMIRESGIPIIEDKRSGIMHHKFMIVDSKTLWSGSMNLTTSSMYHHNNNSILINSPQMSDNFQAEFDRLFDKGMFGPNAHQIPNPEVRVGDASIRVLFSPKGGTQEAVYEELNKAKKNVKFMTFSFTDNTIKDILINKNKSGVKVEGIFDDCMSRNKYSVYRPFRENKIYTLKDGNQALLHHKIIIIDDETVITGSYNFSANAEKSNNENTFIIKSKSIAKFYNSEYFRLANAARNNKNIPDYDHPACGGSKNKG